MPGPADPQLHGISEENLRRIFAQATRTVAVKPLTAREIEVAYVATVEGLHNHQIADRLTITEKTVESHLSHIRFKCFGDPHAVTPRVFSLRPLAVEFWKRIGAFEASEGAE